MCVRACMCACAHDSRPGKVGHSISLHLPPPHATPTPRSQIFLSLHIDRGSFPHAQFANEDTLRIEGVMHAFCAFI